jgi:hypothetical protein
MANSKNRTLSGSPGWGTAPSDVDIASTSLGIRTFRVIIAERIDQAVRVRQPWWYVSRATEPYGVTETLTRTSTCL